jgi:hypothetical protein
MVGPKRQEAWQGLSQIKLTAFYAVIAQAMTAETIPSNRISATVEG